MTNRWFRLAAAVAVAVPVPIAAQDASPDPDSLGPPPPELLADVPHGPLPVGTRYTFTRDSLQWSGAITLADLLSSVPGVYVARAGFLGQPEYAMYAGRGPAGLEIFFDGLPFQPIGPDSVYVDPATIKVAMLRRVDVEVLPSRLRVYLVSERHAGYQPRSFLRVMSGAFSTAQYAGVFQQRWQSGATLDLGADFTGSEGAPGVTRSDELMDIWARFGWIPDARTGAFLEVRRQGQKRDALPSPAQFSPPERDGTRSETLFRFFAGTREDGYGLRFDGGVGSTRWSDSLGTDLGIAQAFGTVRYAQPTLSAEVTGRIADQRVLSSVRASAGWIPMPGIVVSAEAEQQTHRGDRSSTYVGASVGLYWGPFNLTGTLGERDGLQAPALGLDTAQITADRAVRFGFRHEKLTANISLIERDAYEPFAPPDFSWYTGFGITPGGTYLVADAALRPVHPLTLSVWYASPREGTGSAFQPPDHYRWELTFRSKFWRTFRSGAYDFRASYRIETWGEGVAGVGTGGGLETLPGVTFHEMFAQIRLVDFIIFWNMRNARNSLNEYVPGLPYPRIAQTFGVMWTFFN